VSKIKCSYCDNYEIKELKLAKPMFIANESSESNAVVMIHGMKQM
jgi:hypothetical protein